VLQSIAHTLHPHLHLVCICERLEQKPITIGAVANQFLYTLRPHLHLVCVCEPAVGLEAVVGLGGAAPGGLLQQL
jgi:hypothetical protein